jgi:DNA (cytosine-5)-methyltransferase 1
LNDVDYPEIATVEWCFGGGGNHLGLRGVVPGLRLVAACEIEGYPCANVVEKMEGGWLDAAPLWSDGRTFPCHLLRDRVALFIASYPCQGESHAGKRLGEDDPRWLWPAVRRGVEEMRPLRCFFENVEGHLTKGMRAVCGDLEALGYRVAAGVFSAEEVGSSHRRKRVFIMADAVWLHGSGWERALRGRWGICEAGEELGDSAGDDEWRGAVPGEHGEGIAAGGSSGDLADAGDGRCEALRLVRAGESDDGGSGAALADSGREPGAGHDHALLGGEREDGATFEGGGDALADAFGAGLGEHGRALAIRAEHAAAEYRRPHFPPGPGLGGHGVLDDLRKLYARDPELAWRRYRAELANTLEWRRILAHEPALEPALCGVADGMANRVDRLRLCGNGVVPDTAALAYLTLDRELAGLT